MVDLVKGKTVLSYTGAAETFTVTSDGELGVKLWGGAGGNAARPGSSTEYCWTGAGGAIFGTVTVKAGDIIKVEVAQGGQPSSGSKGGTGGWPDGGDGSNVYNIFMGAGGGSTRLYVNDIVVMVAGGGGGAGFIGGYEGGSGGGLSGAAGREGGPNNAPGGTQTGPGQRPNAPLRPGAYLKGAHGHDGAGPAVPNGTGGAGGGGGYYGGAGGANYGGGGGGSSYAAPRVTSVSVREPSPGTSPIPFQTDADWGGGAGGPVYAVHRDATNASPGGNGRAVLNFRVPPPVVVLTDGQTAKFRATGEPATLRVSANGVLKAVAWGGAGGGLQSSSNYSGRRGGSGGFVLAEIPVSASDILEIWTGSGGAVHATGITPTNAYPDGGKGGNDSGAGGGGSTRVYLNGVLVLVAAGGGGGGLGNGGDGGGLTGARGSDQFGRINGEPGTQTAGGSNPYGNGGALKGGDSRGDTYTGGGGGGGWYGGSTGGYQANGGGGSSYGHPGKLATFSTQVGSNGAPAGQTATGYEAGIALGGVTGRASTSENTKGGDGLAVFTFEAASVRPLAPDTPTNLGHLPFAREFTIETAGTLLADLWGAGGGGSYTNQSNANYGGGAGGYTTVAVPLVPGDRVKVEVGQGGSAATGPSQTQAGGWPDGGAGGWGSATNYLSGGGGGSTRLYVNDELIAVAGAGGGDGGAGGSGGAAAGYGYAGGGLSGVPNGTYATAGSQTAAGVTTQAKTPAAKLRGGDAMTDGSAFSGGGGGGGYYGGAPGGVSGAYMGGAGGSGYVKTGVNGSTLAGSGKTPPNAPNATVGRGGQGGYPDYAQIKSGGNGQAQLTLVKPMAVGDVSGAGFSGSGRKTLISTAGALRVKLWGAGGGGGAPSATSSGHFGGAGGFIETLIPVKAGDTVELRVGGGGRVGVQNINAAGGYPDGGAGGLNGAQWSGGGGGGSTRLYINGALRAIAAGGGGALTGSGGSGGGLAGGAGLGTNPGGGGTQTAGGTNPQGATPAVGAGSSLQGGVSPLNTNVSGGGGGGGWYGGASSAGGSGGGGGSSYALGDEVVNLAGAAGVPPRITDTRYPGNNVGYGGVSGYAPAQAANNTAGGDGYAWIGLETIVYPVLAANTPVTAQFSGSARTYDVAKDGVLQCALWGGAGGGGYDSSNRAGVAGSGGYTTVSIPVKKGDLVEVMVGGGGAPNFSGGMEAAGGWPDGGSGGSYSAGLQFGGGGGGGSSRIYVNGVIMAVAGASGGGTYTGVSGCGGGPSGGAGTAGSTGGTQTAPGAAAGPVKTPAAAFQGGSSTNVTTTAGGGGGGGYYGGAAGSVSGYVETGSGGSGFVRAGLVGSTQINAGSQLPKVAPPIAGIARGGSGGVSTTASIQKGGDGLVTMLLEAAEDLPAGSKLTVAASGAKRTYRAAASGFLNYRVWGGAGGSANNTGIPSYTLSAGGAGGLVDGRILVSANDEIVVEVGKGGGAGATASGGLGGWPDGGNGALYSNNISYGGGGGSTRIYVNGVLKVVAGGGGGGALHSAAPTADQTGGSGGLVGGTGHPSTNAAAARGGAGGTQTAGGLNSTNPNDLVMSGGALRGGAGYFDGRTPTSVMATSAYNGAGGGGGYYGGAGGSVATANTIGGCGGGGSSFGPGAQPATSDVPAGTNLADYVSGAAQGAKGINAAGGDGLAVLLLEESVTEIGGSTRSVALTYLGQAQTYTVVSDGALTYSAWGAGGSGGFNVSAETGKGGAGAYARGVLPVKTGDVVKVEVGGGGGAPNATTGGEGGWPDGGSGGLYGSSGVNRGFGAGGGSTRIYLNDVLKVVLGAGGGGPISGSLASPGGGGAGGATYGQDGRPALGANDRSGTGGSPTKGGVNPLNPTDTSLSGGALKGGSGYASNGSRTAITHLSGAGGGGGYYGGGGGYSTASGTPGGAGGGGSSLGAGVQGGADAVPAGRDDPNYQAGIAIGGAPGVGASSAASKGGDGRVFLSFANAQGDLGTITLGAPHGEPVEPVLRGYRGSGSAIEYTVTRTANLVAGLWGAGGAGSQRGNANVDSGSGGGGGFTYVEYPVVAGDIVRVEVGTAGLPGRSTSGGAGGWPDGGAGGLNTTPNAAAGGGGGSSRIYVNNALVAVAGGGGGGGPVFNAAQALAGAGGGESGQNGFGPYSALQFAAGGTQTQGGLTGQPNNHGAQFKGGLGYLAAGPTTPDDNGGGGGGGGYYGGAGGNARSTSSGGGGGSGWVHPGAHYGYTVAGDRRAAAEKSHPFYPTRAGDGSAAGVSGISDPDAGQDGYVVFGVTNTRSGVAKGQPFPNSIVLVQDIKPEVGTGGYAPAAIGTLTWIMDLGGRGTIEAVVNVPFMDYAPEFTAPEAESKGGVVAERAFPGPLSFVAADADVSAPGNAQGTIGAPAIPLQLEAPAGWAEPGVITDITDMPAVVMTPPVGLAGVVGTAGFGEGDFAEGVLLSLDDPDPTAGRFAGTVAAGARFAAPEEPAMFRLLAPQGNVRTSDMLTPVDFPEDGLRFTAPDAQAEPGVDAIGLPYDAPLWLGVARTPGDAIADALASGEGKARPEAGERFIGEMFFALDDARVSAGVTISSGVDPVLLYLRAPRVTAKQEAFVLGSIIPAMLTLSPARAIAGDANAAIGVGDLDSVGLYLSTPYAWVDDSRLGKVRLKRTSVPGRAPETLEPREAALNEADGVLYTRDRDGRVQPTPLAAIEKGASLPGGGAPGDMLRGDGTWGQLQLAYTDPVRLAPPAERIVLSQDVLAGVNTFVGPDQVRYRPFFLPRRTTLNNLSVMVAQGAPGWASFGLVRWEGAPAGLIGAARASTASAGRKTLAGVWVLETGWYAAVFAYEGSDQTIFAAHRAALIPVGDFSLAGDPAAPLTPTSFTDLPAPVQNTETALAFVTAEVVP